MRIAAIVEGHGEIEAVPILVRRIAQEIDAGFVPHVLPPLRVPASRLIKAGEVERSVELAARKLRGRGGILVILDCDWNGCCPAREGPILLERARRARGDTLISVILAKREFEAWFIAAVGSLCGKRNLATRITTPPDPEGIRDAKGWLSAHMSSGESYSETDDQPALAAVFDMATARNSDSFDKCYREIRKMLESLRTGPTSQCAA
ncbi:MAG: DUF4276 family protein [Nitrospirae bacterium]|nr:DUF4276 family protein [Nitrospirota bacterium]